MNDVVLPDFTGNCLTNLMPSVTAALSGQAGRITLPASSRYVVMLVDGLGWNLLHEFRDHAEWLSEHLEAAQRLTTGVPSTTAASLTSLGTGTHCGAHGIVGYTFRDPDSGSILNALSWDGGPEDVTGFRCCRTEYERVQGLGQLSASVSLDRFEHSSLQQIAFAGAAHHGVRSEGDPEEFVGLVMEALRGHQIVYAYERMVDHSGHAHGVGSWQWLEQLSAADDLIATLADALPAETTLLVTGDHGMVNVPDPRKVVIEESADLRGDFVVAGEGRFRQVYTADAPGLARRWAETLGETAIVRTREEAVAEGWFGPDVAPRVLPRIGDVVAAMQGDWALMSERFPFEMGMAGMHGSFTADEMYVPLLVREG